MTPYGRGTAAEKRTATALRKDGYVVMESRGSHGPADLMAAKPGQLLLVQVKLNADGKLRDDWWNELLDAAHRAGGLAIIADWPRRGGLRLRQISGRHMPRSRYWPMTPFATDEIGQAP
jgi:Holliday junction resolvase